VFKLLQLWASLVMQTIKLISFVFFKHINSQLNIYFNIYLFNKHLIALQNSLILQKVLLDYRTLCITQGTALILLSTKYTHFRLVRNKTFNINLLNLITIKSVWSREVLPFATKFNQKLNLVNYSLYDTTNLWLRYKCNLIVPVFSNLFNSVLNITLSLTTTFYILNTYKVLTYISD
jgi:hypothetical protein